MVVVGVVVVVVAMVVDGFGLVVVGAVVGAAVGGGRVGSGAEVGLGVALDPAVVLAIPGLLVVAARTRLLPPVDGSTLESVVVGPTSPAPETQRLPTCIRCQLVACPSGVAEYWAIGEATIRLASRRSRMT